MNEASSRGISFLHRRIKENLANNDDEEEEEEKESDNSSSSTPASATPDDIGAEFLEELEEAASASLGDDEDV